MVDVTQRRRNGSTRAWRRIRAYVLDRDRRTCQVPTPPAGRACGRPATDAGHIVAHVLGGTDHTDNLRAECERHNSTDGARLAQALRSAR